MKWVETQLIPNLPPNAVLIVDNASYHNVTVEPNITSANLKSDMIKWLQTRNIPFDDKLTKPQLYQIIQNNKYKYPPQYKLDRLLEAHGHKVLRLPPYHPELNPIEKIWALVKNWVASRNTKFTLGEVEALTRQRFSELPAEEWTKICRHVQVYENTQIDKEHLLDNVIDSLAFTIHSESSDDSISDDYDSESDSSLGIQPIASYSSDSD